MIQFRSGVLASFFESFTTRYARTSLEVHGTAGSLVAADCMAQIPGGTVVLRSESGEEHLPLRHENYYARGIRSFHDAIGGKGSPAATGEDGVVSLAVALAALEFGPDRPRRGGGAWPKLIRPSLGLLLCPAAGPTSVRAQA